jgi:hypothetical protein
MAERGGLIVIIALGEGIVVTGANFAEATHDPAHVLAFLLAFVGSVLMWWIYFDTGAQRGAEHIEHHAEAGKVARGLHLPAHADRGRNRRQRRGRRAAARRTGWSHGAGTGADAMRRGWSICSATACSNASPARSGLPAVASGRLLSARGGRPVGVADASPALAFVGVSVLVLAVVAVWEWGSYHGGWRSRFAQG